MAVPMKWLSTALMLLPLPADAQDGASPAGDEIRVVGRLPRCRAIASDPLEVADYHRASGNQEVLKPDPISGALRFVPDDNPISAGDAWDRAGRNIGDYVFRAPHDGKPLCIGSFARHPRGFAQLRRILDAKSFQGRYARFTAFVATNRSDEVRFWLAAGDNVRIYQGGDTSNQPLWGTHGGWIPVSLTIGPVTRKATKLSYGFLLMGKGIVWVTQPQIEILDSVDQGAKSLPLSHVPQAARRPTD